MFLTLLLLQAAFATLERALQFKHLIEGVGLDSGESGNPPSKFKNVFKRAKQEGWKIVAHAGTQKKVKSPNFVGEEGPPGYIYEALDVLGAQRIDHGVRSIEDPVLCKRLVAEHTPLTVCPLSNIKLCVFKKPEDHNLKKLLDMGLNVCINAGQYNCSSMFYLFQTIQLISEDTLLITIWQCAMLLTFPRKMWLPLLLIPYALPSCQKKKRRRLFGKLVTMRSTTACIIKEF